MKKLMLFLTILSILPNIAFSQSENPNVGLFPTADLICGNPNQVPMFIDGMNRCVFDYSWLFLVGIVGFVCLVGVFLYRRHKKGNKLDYRNDISAIKDIVLSHKP